MSYDMVIETPEALKMWKDEYIRLINAKRQSVTLQIKSVAPSVAENYRRWLRYADVAIKDINAATSKSAMIATYNVIMADHEKLVANNVTKNEFYTASQSGVKLTGKKTGTPASTVATSGGALPTQIVEPRSTVKPTRMGLSTVIVAGVLLWIFLG
jgi:hypothetical protein